MSPHAIRVPASTVRAACELVGRCDALSGRAPESNELDVYLRASNAIWTLINVGKSEFLLWPPRGAASLCDDWLRWYLEAYELERGNRAEVAR